MMKMPALVTLASLSLALTACGGDGNKSSTIGQNATGNNSNNSLVLKFSQISEENDPANYYNAVGLSRQDYTIGNGQFGVTTTPIWGKVIEDKTPSYMVGKNFFRKQIGNTELASYAKNSTITKSADLYVWDYDTLGDNGQKVHQTYSFKPIDISGVFNFAEKEKQGLYLDMTANTAKLPTSVTFPTNTYCYAEYQSSADRALYSFDETDVTSYTSLSDFMAAKGISSAKGTISYVGTNNELPLLTYTTTSTEPKYAILYNGKVYEDIFASTSTYTANVDLAKGKVYCDFIDTTAADIIAQEVKKLHP